MYNKEMEWVWPRRRNQITTEIIAYTPVDCIPNVANEDSIFLDGLSFNAWPFKIGHVQGTDL